MWWDEIEDNMCLGILERWVMFFRFGRVIKKFNWRLIGGGNEFYASINEDGWRSVLGKVWYM